MEEWRPIPGFGGYKINSVGIIIGRRGWNLKPRPDKDGYYVVTIDGKCVTIHKLVALAFIPNPHHLPTIDHINRERTDNRVCNLRWADYTTQNRNSTRKNSSGERYIYRNGNGWYVNCKFIGPSKWFKIKEEAIHYRDMAVTQSTTDES